MSSSSNENNTTVTRSPNNGQQQQQQQTMHQLGGLADFAGKQQQQQTVGNRSRGGGRGGSNNSASAPQQQGRKCARCAASFGRFYNTGAICPGCRSRVCRQCRESWSSSGNHQQQATNDWLCSLCHKVQELRSVGAAEWRRSGRDDHPTALDILRYSIRRAWTINGPPARWSVARKSAEFRLYRSLPNRRCNNDVSSNKNSSSSSKIRPPRLIGNRAGSATKQNDSKRSSIPVFRNNRSCSREFEDIRGPHESPKRSLIPQRYRGSTDDLRRSREDISAPSFIPKLLSPRNNFRCLTPAKSQPQLATIAKPTTPPALFRLCRSREGTDSAAAAAAATTPACPSLLEEPPKMVQESSTVVEEKSALADVDDDRQVCESKLCDKIEGVSESNKDSQLGKKVDEPQVIRRKFSKEEQSNDDTDDAHNRRCSSHFSPEASPLSTRSSKYSPRESESEPTPALPRKITSGESSSASQRIRDAITRTRRESNSSAKYESSGSEGVRLSESGLSSYVDIARRVKLFAGLGPAGSCDEIPQRDSATSAGEDDDLHLHSSLLRDPARIPLAAQQGRVMLRRRRQFDAQGPRRRGRSHGARACCGGGGAAEDLHHQQQQQQQVVGRTEGEEAAAALLDYRRLVFISSDSSSGREEDDADSSCSGSSYLNGQPVPSQQAASSGCSLDDCDWDYFESNSLKLPPLQGVTRGPPHLVSPSDWTCCPATPGGCCQTCGGSKNAKVLPVPVPIPVPVPYPVPVPASLWTGEFAGLERARAAAASSMISREAARLDSSLQLSLRGCDPSSAAWFSWNPRFDSSSLLFSQSHIFPGQLSTSTSDALLQTEEKVEPEVKKAEEAESKKEPESEQSKEQQQQPEVPTAALPADEEEDQQQQRMFRHSQEQDSRSSSGRSSADSSDLEDSASHRFSRVFIVNDDSLTSDNDIEDNEDSDSAREGKPITLRRVNTLPDRESGKVLVETNDDEPVLLRRIRLLDEDANVIEDEEQQIDDDEEQTCKEAENRYCAADNEDNNQQEIASYDEIYLASTQDKCDNLILLKSIKSIDPESSADQSSYFADSNFTPGFRAFPKLPDDKEEESPEEEDDSSNDSAVMPDSLEVSMQDLQDSIDVATSCDIERALLAASSPIEEEEGKRVGEEEEGAAADGGGQVNCSSSESSSNSSALTGSSSDELHEYTVITPPRAVAPTITAAAEPSAAGVTAADHHNTSSESAALMAKSRKKWQIPASFDIKGIASTHYMPPAEREKSRLSPLLDPGEEENANGLPPIEQQDSFENEDENDQVQAAAAAAGGKTEETTGIGAHDEGSGAGAERVRGEQVGGSEEEARYPRAVERRTPTRKEDSHEDEIASPPVRRRDWTAADSLNHINNNINNGAGGHINNKYRSLVMITQGAYQPVNVITSDTTTLLQPQSQQSGYYQLGRDANQEASRKSVGLGSLKKPLPCKRLLASQEPEVDSGLSVGSASESDDVQSVKNATKQASRSPVLLSNLEEEESSEPPPVIKQCIPYEPPKRAGPLILEDGLADDDSWVEEISHDEDEQSITTATEESSEDEAANNLGDREEELRGYHRQAIDFTLHTIVEESCEESESEHATASWRRRLVSASAPDLDKYLIFGADALGKNTGELDSLSDTSSIFSEGLDSLSREENSQNSNEEKKKKKKSGDFSNGSSRLEKYFLSELLGPDQDRRDSDGSVGSDSEGRPSPEAQRRKRLVRARGTGRSHSSSLDNLLALAHSSMQDGSPATDGQESLSEGSSTETDNVDENLVPAFGADGQFDTVKRKKKKQRHPGAQSPRVSEDRNRTPEPRSDDRVDEDVDARSDDDGAKTPQPEHVLQAESVSSAQDESSSSARLKQTSRDSGFVGSCDDLLQNARNSENQGSGDGANAGDNAAQTKDYQHREKERNSERLLTTADERNIHERILESQRLRERLAKMEQQVTSGGSLARKDSFNNWSSDEETNLMMSKMRQFFKTMVANANNQTQQAGSTASSAASPAPSPRFSSRTRGYAQTQNRTKPPQLVYFESELTRLMKTVPGIRDEQVREIVEYLSSEDTWSDSYDSSDYTSSDLEGAAAGGRRSALQEQISQSCQQIISNFDTNCAGTAEERKDRRDAPIGPDSQQALGRDTAFVYQKLVQSFTKMAGDSVPSDASSTAHSSPPLIAKVMHHIGSRLVALMHQVSESNSTGGHSHSSAGWGRRYPHHRAPSSASTTEDDDSTSDSASAPTLPRSKSHDPLLLINGHANATSMPPEAEEREASDYERFSWRGSFESALMAADSRTKLSLLACSGDVSATAMAAKRRSAGDLLFSPKSFSREQLDRVRSCGSIGGAVGAGNTAACSGSIEEKIWSERRRSSVPDANTRGESGASAGDEDTEDEELEYGDPRATTLPRGGMQVTGSAAASATNSLPRQSGSSASVHKSHSSYHFLPQHNAVKSARYRPPGFTRNSPSSLGALPTGPKRAYSAPGLQLQSRSRRQQQMSHAQANASSSSANVSASASISADEASLSEACSTPIIGSSSRTASASHGSIDLDDMDRSFTSTHHATRASLSSLGARSDSMASVYSGAGEGRWCGSVAVRGEVEFSLQYDYKQLTLQVHVTQCRDLAPVDVKRNRSDPYVKVYLLPDKSKSGKRKTKVKKHTLNPVFDETLKFHTSLNSLEARTLWLTVWHSDMFGRNDFLGEVRMPLENKIFDDPRPQWYPLQERTEPFDDPVAYKGEVIVGLKFVPPDPSRQERDRDSSALGKLKKNWSKGALHVLVKEARSLQTRAKNSGTCDPFCKSYLLPDKGRSGKQKTGVVRRSTGSPIWNHTFVYKDVSLQELAERGLELTVWDHDRIASNEFLGGVRFNLGTGKHYGKIVDWMDATGREMSLWQNMLERPNFWVEGAVTLRPNLHNYVKAGTS